MSNNHLTAAALNKGIIFPVTILCLLIAGCTNVPTAAPSLKETLSNAAADGRYLYAHQDDLSYGHTWNTADDGAGELTRSDIFDVCSDYPAIVGFDLGGIEMGDTCNLDGVSFDIMRQAAIAHSERGGFVTFSWHIRNPLTGGDAWDCSSKEVVQSVLPGGQCHEMFISWLSKLADFLDTLKDSEGKRLQFIFRPWHEHTGSWFWWGADLCSSEQYKALWSLTYNYITGERGMDNILWAYSPGSTCLEQECMVRYPGDEMVDIIGVDCYDGGAPGEVHPEFINEMQQSLGYLDSIARGHNLLLAVTETGLESVTYDKWWTESLQKAVEGHPVCYILTWRNASDRPTHYYAPWKGSQDADDFRLFHDSDRTVFLKDLTKKDAE